MKRIIYLKHFLQFLEHDKYDNCDDAASVSISYEFISVIIQKKKQTHVNE